MRRKVLMVLVVLVVLVTLVACGDKKAEKPYYPLEELTPSSGYDEKLLKHYKEVILNSGLDAKDIALKIDDSVREEVVAYILDDDGKAIEEYLITGELKDDIIWKRKGYKYQIKIEPSILLGTRVEE